MGVGNTDGDSLLLGRDERGFYLRARGSIRATLCYPLRESFLPALASLPPGLSVFVDLSACTYMDSTFIGLLVAADRKVRRSTGGRLRILRASQSCRELFGGMGLGDHFPVEESDIPFPADMAEVEPTGEKPAARFVLDAHEALMETSEEARRKFTLLSDMLRRALNDGKTPPGTPEE